MKRIVQLACALPMTSQSRVVLSVSTRIREKAGRTWAALLVAGLSGLALAAEPEWHTATVQGIVRDHAGRPLSNATVRFGGLKARAFPPIDDIDSLEQIEAFRGCRTDEEGRFSHRMQFGGEQPLLVRQITASLDGYVSQVQRTVYQLPPGGAAEVAFRLEPGEVLSGEVEPLVWGLREAARWSDDPRFANFLLPMGEWIRVEGESFDEQYSVLPGGKFQLYVPKGVYRLSVVGKEAVLDAVPSGTRNLVLRAPTTPLAKETAAAAFDALWKDMNGHYSYFAHKQIDWESLRGKYRDRLLECSSEEHFVVELLKMLAELRDMHVWVEYGKSNVSAYQQIWDSNYHGESLLRELEDTRRLGFATVATTKTGGMGYIAVEGLQASAEQVDQVLAELDRRREVPGFIVDLRMCGGGDERIARRVAGFFCQHETPYARHKFRGGPAHTDFAPESIRQLAATKNPYTRPVVCLIGNRTMSSAEAFALMMKALPHVTMVGARTRGSSGNPSPFVLESPPLKVFYSRWVAMEADGRVFEGTGIVPEVVVKGGLKEHQQQDITLRRAVKLLSKP